MYVVFALYIKSVLGQVSLQLCNAGTVEPVLKDHPTGHENVVSQDRLALVTGAVILKM